jgi:transposase InsO family protein
MIYAFIEAEHTRYPVKTMCKVLGVSRSGYYEWRRREPSRRAREDAVLTTEIADIFEMSRQSYGRHRIGAELRDRGHRCGHNRVGRLMRQAQLRVRHRQSRPRTTQSNHRLPIAPNLLQRDFTATAPHQKWLADITYVATREGWLYLATVLDTFSRKIVGWSMQERLTIPLVRDAFCDAIARRLPTQPLIHHSDRGSQYASHAYQDLLSKYHVVCSMSRTADCYDNAMMESFFATLKGELPVDVFPSRDDARYYIFDFIEVWYNRQRRHSALDYCSPEAFEQRHLL